MLQVEDQTYDSADNQALLQSYKTGAPVRVFRGKIGAKQERLYVYEGLYKVTAHKKEPSQDGPLVSLRLGCGSNNNRYGRVRAAAAARVLCC